MPDIIWPHSPKRYHFIFDLPKFYKDNPIVWVITLLTGVLHLAVAGRYDFFRNELYFIVCGRHPSFGYVDQPPLVPLIDAATQIFGLNVWLLRLPAVLAAIALVPLTAAFALRLGGGKASAILAATGAALAPALAGMTTTTTTATFEPFCWTLCAYWITRGFIEEEGKDFLWAGLTAGLAMEMKYGIAFWLIGLSVGMAFTQARKIFSKRQLWYGIAAGMVIAAPSLIWQTAQGWPFLEHILYKHNSGANFTGTPVRFWLNQALAINVALAPLWIAGIVAPFVTQRVKAARFLSIAFLGTALIICLTNGKDYYFFPVYPTMFAVGAVAFGGMKKWLLGSWLLVVMAFSFIVAPVALPILDPPVLSSYLDKTHLRPSPDEAAAVGAPLVQVFSDELGWREMEGKVAAVYLSLPVEERRGASILTSNYGEAAAIDVYGPADGLPRAISGHLQYYLWGPGDHPGDVIIHVNGDPDRWKGICDKVEMAGTFGVPYAMPYENDRPIFICKGLRVDLKDIWYRFKRYQ